MDTKNCRDSYIDIAARAEIYYRRLYPDERLDYNQTIAHNQLSWINMAREIAAQLNHDWDSLEYSSSPSTEADVIRQSFDDHNTLLTSRFTHMRDLTQDGRLGNNIRLCDECLLPFELQALTKKNGKWLCTATDYNTNPCDTDTSADQEMRPSEPVNIPQPPSNPNAPGPWINYF